MPYPATRPALTPRAAATETARPLDDVASRPQAATGCVRLLDGPLGAADLPADPTGRTGAVVTFSGVVRGDPMGSEGTTVTHLEFECYPEMALAELERIRLEALARFGLNGLDLHHRTGRLQVGDEIVRVSAAAAHRREAFEAAAWAMDEVKRRVPLWKREVSATGTSRWVSGADCSCGR